MCKHCHNAFGHEIEVPIEEVQAIKLPHPNDVYSVIYYAYINETLWVVDVDNENTHSFGEKEIHSIYTFLKNIIENKNIKIEPPIKLSFREKMEVPIKTAKKGGITKSKFEEFWRIYPKKVR